MIEPRREKKERRQSWGRSYQLMMLASSDITTLTSMRRTRPGTMPLTSSSRHQCPQRGHIAHHVVGPEVCHQPNLPGQKVHITGLTTTKHPNIAMSKPVWIIFRKRSPEKQLTESISKLSVSDVKSRPLGLSQDQVDTLQHAAHGGADQGHDNVSAMDKYLQMKTQQEMDSIQCSH